MNTQDPAFIILAAGKGTRMKSEKSKVLHEIAGKAMIERTVEIIEKLKSSQITVVVNPSNFKDIKKLFKNRVQYAIQKKQLGTAHAAEIGLKSLKGKIKNVGIVYGDDTAFYKSSTIEKVLQRHLNSHAKITFATLTAADPSGLGRILRKNNKLISIVEEKDATENQRKIKEVNNGLYFFEKKYLEKNLTKLTPSTIAEELYLTDLIQLALQANDTVESFLLDSPIEWQGVNTPIELAKANLRLNKRVHFMGVGGSGASAAAQIAKGMGYDVDGCDKNDESSYTGNLLLTIYKGHTKNHLKGKSVLAVSPAVEISNKINPELNYAKKRGVPIVTWQQFQGGILQENKFVIAVAGAYGKSTTTAMIGKILEDLEFDPTVEVGAKLIDWNRNYRIGSSKYYVCEADEYNDNFLNYHPDIAVILNLKWDHPDYFKTEQDLQNSYKEFIENIKPGGSLVLGPDPKLQEVVRVIKNGSNLRIVRIKDFGHLNLKIIGDFRKDNANAALTVAQVLNLDTQKATKTLSKFMGLARRLEFKGTVKGVKVYDDYAVQAYTTEKTANALKSKYPDKKMALVLEPHTFSRVKTFFEDFIAALKKVKAEKILITDVYASREKGDSAKLSQKLAKVIGTPCEYSGSLKSTAAYLKKNLNDYGIICSMGAGNVYKLYDLLKTK